MAAVVLVLLMLMSLVPQEVVVVLAAVVVLVPTPDYCRGRTGACAPSKRFACSEQTTTDGRLSLSSDAERQKRK